MSFLFYDLETYGLTATQHRISQFAAIRTDDDLNETGEVHDFRVRPSTDTLPSPAAMAVTRTFPRTLASQGLTESRAFAQIAKIMGTPGTCVLGHNTYRFDDAFVRNGLYRNFQPIYDREWRDGNSRFDTLNLLRAAYALRPDGIQWPVNADGNVFFQLESLAELNGVRTGDAHEALSDVRATIGMAKLVRDHHPKFWAYLLGLRDKQRVRSLLSDPGRPVYIAIQSAFGLANSSAAPVIVLFPDETRSGRHVLFNLRHDPTVSDPNQPAMGMLSMAINESPPLFPLEHVTDSELDRLGLNRSQILTRAQWVRDSASMQDLQLVWRSSRREFLAEPNVDAQIYDGFFSPADEQWRRRVRAADATELSALVTPAGLDRRLEELLFRYRARNFQDSLSPSEQSLWDTWRMERLNAQLSDFLTEFDQAELRFAHDPGAMQALNDTRQFVAELGLDV